MNPSVNNTNTTSPSNDKERYVKYKFKYMVLKNRFISMVIGSLHSLAKIYETALTNKSESDLDRFTGWLESEILKIKVINDSNKAKLNEARDDLSKALEIGKQGLTIQNPDKNIKQVRSLLYGAQEKLSVGLVSMFPGTLTGQSIRDICRYIRMTKEGVSNRFMSENLEEIISNLKQNADGNEMILQAVALLKNVTDDNMLNNLNRAISLLQSVDLSVLTDFYR